MLRQQSLALVDEQGVEWDPFGCELARSLNTHLRGHALADYTVRNMGYLGLQRYRRWALVRLRLRFVTRPALAAAADILRWQCIDRVVVSPWNEEWCDQILPAELLVRTMACYSRDPPGPCAGCKGDYRQTTRVVGRNWRFP